MVSASLKVDWPFLAASSARALAASARARSWSAVCHGEEEAGGHISDVSSAYLSIGEGRGGSYLLLAFAFLQQLADLLLFPLQVVPQVVVLLLRLVDQLVQVRRLLLDLSGFILDRQMRHEVVKWDTSSGWL